MKNIFEAPFVREMEKTTANMYRLGWDERNGGNVSYLLDEKEVAEYLDLNHVIRTIPTGFDAKPLIGKIFIVTGTEKYFKNVESDPETNLGIVLAAAGREEEIIYADIDIDACIKDNAMMLSYMKDRRPEAYSLVTDCTNF